MCRAERKQALQFLLLVDPGRTDIEMNAVLDGLGFRNGDEHEQQVVPQLTVPRNPAIARFTVDDLPIQHARPPAGKLTGIPAVDHDFVQQTPHAVSRP